MVAMRSHFLAHYYERRTLAGTVQVGSFRRLSSGFCDALRRSLLIGAIGHILALHALVGGVIAV